YAEGSILGGLGDPTGYASLMDAVRLAGEAHDDRLEARALVDAVRNLAADTKSASGALIVADTAAGAVARAGGDDLLRIRLLRFRAEALLIDDKIDAAQTLLMAAYARSVAAFGTADGETLATVNQLTNAARNRGEYSYARRLDEANLAASIALYGEEHRRVATVLNNLGIDVGESDPDASAGYFRRALAVKDKIGGPETQSFARTLLNLGELETMGGDLEHAATHLERAVQIGER